MLSKSAGAERWAVLCPAPACCAAALSSCMCIGVFMLIRMSVFLSGYLNTASCTCICTTLFARLAGHQPVNTADDKWLQGALLHAAWACGLRIAILLFHSGFIDAPSPCSAHLDVIGSIRSFPALCNCLPAGDYCFQSSCCKLRKLCCCCGMVKV